MHHRVQNRPARRAGGRPWLWLAGAGGAGAGGLLAGISQPAEKGFRPRMPYLALGPSQPVGQKVSVRFFHAMSVSKSVTKSEIFLITHGLFRDVATTRSSYTVLLLATQRNIWNADNIWNDAVACLSELACPRDARTLSIIKFAIFRLLATSPRSS